MCGCVLEGLVCGEEGERGDGASYWKGSAGCCCCCCSAKALPLPSALCVPPPPLTAAAVEAARNCCRMPIVSLRMLFTSAAGQQEDEEAWFEKGRERRRRGGRGEREQQERKWGSPWQEGQGRQCSGKANGSSPPTTHSLMQPILPLSAHTHNPPDSPDSTSSIVGRAEGAYSMQRSPSTCTAEGGEGGAAGWWVEGVGVAAGGGSGKEGGGGSVGGARPEPLGIGVVGWEARVGEHCRLPRSELPQAAATTTKRAQQGPCPAPPLRALKAVPGSTRQPSARTLRRCGVCVGNSSGVLEATLRSTSVGFSPSQARLQQPGGRERTAWHGQRVGLAAEQCKQGGEGAATASDQPSIHM